MQQVYTEEQFVILQDILEEYMHKHQSELINEPLLLESVKARRADFTPLDFEIISDIIHNGYCYDHISRGYEKTAFEIKQIADQSLAVFLNKQIESKESKT